MNWSILKFGLKGSFYQGVTCLGAPEPKRSENELVIVGSLVESSHTIHVSQQMPLKTDFTCICTMPVYNNQTELKL